MREAWAADERLDDLNHRVDNGFTEVNREFQALRAEMSAMNRSLIQIGAGAMVTMFVGFEATIATVLSQG